MEERLGGREPGWKRGGNEERGQASKSRNQETPGKGSEGLQQVQGGNLGGTVWGVVGVCVCMRVSLCLMCILASMHSHVCPHVYMCSQCVFTCPWQCCAPVCLRAVSVGMSCDFISPELSSVS